MTDRPEAPHAAGAGPGGDAPVAALPAADPEPGGGVITVVRRPGPAAGLDRTRAAAARFTGGWPLGRIIGAGVVVAGLFSVLAIVIGGAALASLGSDRGRVVDTLDPAAYHASQLEVALLNQETGVRGYALTAQRPFLQPYYAGLLQQRQQAATLHELLAGMPAAQGDLAQVLAKVGAWRSSYAGPTISHVQATGKPLIGAADQGKAAFDSLRVTLGALQADLARERVQAVGSLNHSASVLDAACIAIAVGLVLVLAIFAFVLWRSAILPLSRLAADARQVASGDFEHRLDSPGGPQEVRAVGSAVDQMRERILAELSALRTANASLEARTEDLQRSNSELEQFAYVASHDLQEPLRKVASFCQLLQRRYAGRLDAKADEYIEHAVDGAKRMQALINDLLAFSRVGRTAQKREPVSLGLLLAQAWANLAGEVRRTHATIEQGELPVVLGEASLLTAVFQNLLSNALKFRGEAPPRVSVSARRDGRQWLFTFSDNGIGIEPEYADRIFVIFQRLHDKASYPGTGIGLAMVRKIIEYHGGQIWLDTEAGPGARFRFTLPMLPNDEDTDD
jgi:signal transduction histidine kinase